MSQLRLSIPQMAKNKGLTPKRKKIDRNPRVKHREKFKRAKIRRKGQVCTSEFQLFASAFYHSTLKRPCMSDRYARFVRRKRDTAESCLGSALVSRRAPNSSNNEWKQTSGLVAAFNSITELFIGVVKKRLIIAQSNIYKLPLTSVPVWIHIGLFTRIQQ